MVPESTSAERNTAALCHLVSIPLPFLGPIFFLATQRRSKFVVLHAAQALFEAIILSSVLFVATAISVIISLSKVWEAIQTRGESLTWSLLWETLIKAGATWVILGVISAFYFVSSLLDARRASQGKWKGSLISGPLARRATKQLTGLTGSR